MLHRLENPVNNTPMSPSESISHVLNSVDRANSIRPSSFTAREIGDKPPPIDMTNALNQEAQLLQQILDCLKQEKPPSKFEFICNAILQLLAISFVIIFGVFSVLAYNAAIDANKQSSEANQQAVFANEDSAEANRLSMLANQQSSQANQLALLALCLSNENNACAPIMQNATKTLASLVTAVLSTPGPSTSLSTAFPAPGSRTAQSHLNTAAIIGIVVGVAAVTASLVTSYIRFRHKYR